MTNNYPDYIFDESDFIYEGSEPILDEPLTKDDSCIECGGAHYSTDRYSDCIIGVDLSTMRGIRIG